MAQPFLWRSEKPEVAPRRRTAMADGCAVQQERGMKDVIRTVRGSGYAAG
jgi:hypothetical protein